MANPKKTFQTPQGEITRELTNDEVDSFAASGDNVCKQFKAADLFGKAGNIQAKVDAIAQYLGLM